MHTTTAKQLDTPDLSTSSPPCPSKATTIVSTVHEFELMLGPSDVGNTVVHEQHRARPKEKLRFVSHLHLFMGSYRGSPLY